MSAEAPPRKVIFMSGRYSEVINARLILFTSTEAGRKAADAGSHAKARNNTSVIIPPKMFCAHPPQQAPIATEKLGIENKLFFLDLKENARGRFLKITEDVGGRRNTIMVPIPALADFIEALKRLGEFEATL